MNELENLAFKFHFNINIYNKHLLPNIASNIPGTYDKETQGFISL